MFFLPGTPTGFYPGTVFQVPWDHRFGRAEEGPGDAIAVQVRTRTRTPGKWLKLPRERNPASGHNSLPRTMEGKPRRAAAWLAAVGPPNQGKIHSRIGYR